MANQIFNFDFTYGKDKCLEEFKTREKFVEQLSKIAKKWVFQEEKGTESGYLHYQGRLSLRAKRRVATFTKFASEQFPSIHVSPTTTDNLGNLFYVTKEDTRVDGPWSSQDEVIYLPKQWDVKLRPWQQVVLQMALFRDFRSVNVIIDTKGGIGKSTLAGYARVKHGYHFIAVHDSTDRMIASVCDMLMERNNRDPKCFFVDVPRSFRKSRIKALFLAIEQLKNGWVTDSRYKYREWIFESPCVWVFCNFQLKNKYLSRDRWKFFHIVDDQLEKYKPEHVTADEPSEPRG